MSILHNDEGMWLINNLPLERFRTQYGFEPTAQWLERAQKAAGRMSHGSGFFVSANGLFMTNHHVARGFIHAISTPQNDYLKNGFYAPIIQDEIKLPNCPIKVLMNIQDVTARVKAAVKAGATNADSFKAKQAEIARIEKESHEATALISEVVTLYRGAVYHLYQYKQYTDVRLVFTPEAAISDFGGDVDNFEFPRYCLDVTFLRAYENGVPATIKHFFTWSNSACTEGDLVFVSGHPGSTERLSTVTRLISLRNSGVPYILSWVRRTEITLQQFCNRSEENKRKAISELLVVQNTRKVYMGELQALQDPQLIALKVKSEQELREKIAQNPEMQKAYNEAWNEVMRAEKAMLKVREKLNLLENGWAFNTALFGIARLLLRLSVETRKPDHKRLPGYRSGNLSSLKEEIVSPAPIYKDFEEYKLGHALSFLAESLGFDDPLVSAILAGKSPQERAAELVAGTKLDDLNERKRLLDGGQKAINQSTDSMVLLAKLVDSEARRLQKRFETRVQEVREQAYAKIAQAKFALYGTALYPDATFTLRIAFGQIKGYREGNVSIPNHTTIGGAFKHADWHLNKEPWQLPESWERKRAELAQSETPFNFLLTPDIIGGNSGSPVFNSAGEIVGIIFDGNLYSLASAFIYTDEKNRAIAVHAAGIAETLKKVYDAQRLIQELIP